MGALLIKGQCRFYYDDALSLFETEHGDENIPQITNTTGFGLWF